MNFEAVKDYYKRDLPSLLREADSARQEHFGNTITFSPNITIPISNYCQNNCDYCSFRPRAAGVGRIYTPGEVQQTITAARASSYWEVLLMTGEGGDESAEVKEFLNSTQWETLNEYYLWVMQAAVKEGLLPHSNFGVVSEHWLGRFKPWNASMGLMLESTSTGLLAPGGPHHKSPGKSPALRLQFLRLAGELRIPFTTGILVGVGEAVLDRLETLWHIAQLAQRYENIQEVIIQNFVPNPGTPMGAQPPPPVGEMLRLVAVARLVAGAQFSIQVPPNLNPGTTLQFIRAGADDLGGISPVTIDYINPSEKWPNLANLREDLRAARLTLAPRLPVYDRFISDKFLSTPILQNIETIRAAHQSDVPI